MYNSLLVLIEKEDRAALDVEVREDIIRDLTKIRDEYREKRPDLYDYYVEDVIKENEKLNEAKRNLMKARADIRKYLQNTGIIPSIFE